GRPVREISAALEKLTGQKHGEQELYHIHLAGLPSQRVQKQKVFDKVAQAWATWWEQNWEKQVKDKAYAKVNLVIDQDESTEPIAPGTHFKTAGGGSNWILESVLNPDSKRVFYDLDVGRVSAVPDKWRLKNNIAANLDEIIRWAANEGFDLMGTEYTLPD